jgi:hypothetical protein
MVLKKDAPFPRFKLTDQDIMYFRSETKTGGTV